MQDFVKIQYKGIGSFYSSVFFYTGRSGEREREREREREVLNNCIGACILIFVNIPQKS